MWYVIKENPVIRYGIVVILAGLVAYFIIAPLLLGGLFPQYQVVKKYSNIVICSDVAPGAKTNVFLPLPCASLNKADTLGCLYNAPHYSPPEHATSDQKTLCHLFVSGTDARGIKNSALPVLPISETAVRNILAISSFTILAILFFAAKLMWQTVRHLKL